MRGLVLAWMMLLGFTAAGPAAAQRAGEFDLYVLSLSWSPTFCANIGKERGDQQCASARPHAFILHGLWPQYTRGYPEFCAGQSPPRIPDRLLTDMLDIMPSRGLIIHEWRKHGTCSGLSPQVYFDTARRALSQISIPKNFARASTSFEATPDAVQEAFLSANPSLSRDGVSVTCQKGLLEEVRICLSRTLQPRRCAEVDRQSCRATNIRVPAAAR